MNLFIFYSLYNLTLQYQWLDNLVWFFAVPLIYILFFIAAFYICINYNLFNIKNVNNTLKNRWKEILYIPLSAILAWSISKILKIIFHTPRPPEAISNIHSLFQESGYAFPSAHAMTISALAFAIFYVNKRIGYVFIIGAILVGIARIMAGVHFPIDIIGGYVFGFLVAYLLKTR